MACPNKIRNETQLNIVFQEILSDSLMICAYTKEFLNSLKKRDKSVLSKLFKKIEQIVRNPNIGKYMCANRSGQQEVYIADAFRLYYSFNEKENLIEFLEFSHKKHQ